MILVLLAACKKAAIPAVAAIDPEEDSTREGPEQRVVGSGVWKRRGLELYVPPDWAGREGPGDRVLGLLQAQTGAEFAIYSFDEPVGRPRPEVSGCRFVSEAGYRTVPVLGLTSTATCEDQGRIRQVWWGMRDGAEWHVELLYPERGAVRARLAAGPLLEGLRSAE